MSGEPKWVELYLVPQTEVSSMPETVIGLLVSETPSVYILNPMLEAEEDEEFNKQYVDRGLNAFNKTYIWRCKFLEEEPKFLDKISYEEQDGL